MTKPIQFESLGLSFPHKTCFSDVSGQIFAGSRVAIIGRNGSGKTSLLKILAGVVEPSEGVVNIPKQLVIGYVPQVIEAFDDYSGGQRFNQSLTKALAQDPDVLMLDEPTNHLDSKNRRALIHLLQHFTGSVVMVTHDVEALRSLQPIIWHMNDTSMHIFSGQYDDYLREMQVRRSNIEAELAGLSRQKKDAHRSLMKEQQRAKQSRKQGEKNIKQRKWPTVVSESKARNAQETSGRKQKAIHQHKQRMIEQLAEHRLPEVIMPTFNIEGVPSNQVVLRIKDGQANYSNDGFKIEGIDFYMSGLDKVAIVGNNGSGKSTLIKATLQDKALERQGEWVVPNLDAIGYLDQHYQNLKQDLTVLDIVSQAAPSMPHQDVRNHLNDFLFRKNEEVHARVSTLSGGEKARLSLAQIAVNPPKLLILDEMTNNLDLETRAHVIQVLSRFPGAVLVISHDVDFLQAIGVTESIELVEGVMQ
jgi:ATPase subunit of ABC transporter with duplicated ATPase domains